ncbi:hypothetical protein PR202_ga25288 [Eleusine coracana subsp. coracana]|uniref:Amidase domain-containing protein n=1 Tax=Eleusine coracana subsp. coracana TaxID=191504 RepID=A0AAV5DB36_ELECO|nr:hypothetical protein PR202_ga25288 [Eleusine coracana subsp. coracana]
MAAELRLRQALAAAVMLLAAAAGSHIVVGFEFHEPTVDAIRLGFRNGSLTSTSLVRFYLDQIARFNPLLHAVIEVNPDALNQAARADAERSSSSSGRVRLGWLHGVPVLLKDNIATRDRLNTTAGSLALLGSVVKRDAGVVSRLRRAGAVILGKANPSEWSNFRPVESGWSARGGQTLNPYVLSHTPCGSSSGPGVAAAANMAAVTLGSETDGSILCPAAANSVVGIKPTVGLTSRSGVIPITPLQDSIGEHGAILVTDLDITIDWADLITQERIAMNAEFKISINAYLSDLEYSPVRSLAQVIAFNKAHPVEERLKDFGQPDLIAAEKTNGIGKVEREAIRRLNKLSINGLEKLMKEHRLDAIVAANNNASPILAIGGYPGIVVPAGYDDKGVPFGICFGGLKGYEPRLIEMAYGFEQATNVRRQPSFKH